jgi:hypothetical protein
MAVEDWTKGDGAASTIRAQAQRLVQAARDRGYVLTIGLEARQPLAMGHHEAVIELRPVRRPE